jgi:hypothetical protein
MILYILYGFIILTTIVVIILVGKGIFPVDKPKSDPKSKYEPKPEPKLKLKSKSEPCINYVPFYTGFINDLPPHQKSANLCCNDVMYPINPIYVNYGLPIRSDCDVNIFNSQP